MGHTGQLVLTLSQRPTALTGSITSSVFKIRGGGEVKYWQQWWQWPWRWLNGGGGGDNVGNENRSGDDNKGKVWW